MSEEIKKTFGESANLKKGRAAWKPANITEVTNKEPGYRYRLVSKDPTNLAKKAAEGWEIVNGLQADNASLTDTGRMADGKQMTSVHERHDVVLQRIPEDLAQERDEYYNALSAKQVSGLTAHIKKDMGHEGANTHGSITISSRRGETVLN
jgi:hypothetical protein